MKYPSRKVRKYEYRRIESGVRNISERQSITDDCNVVYDLRSYNYLLYNCYIYTDGKT